MEHFRPVLIAAIVSMAIVPAIGGVLLFFTSRFAKIPNVSLRRCYTAYLAAYVAATVVCAPLSLLLIGRIGLADFPTFAIVFVLALAIHILIIHRMLKAPFLRSLVAHGSAIVLVGIVLAIALWIPLQKARQAARITLAKSRLHAIGRAMHEMMDNNNDVWPPPASYDPLCQPLLSWRVHLLLYLGESGLYREFHLDEPWDSPHNRTLILRMPRVYSSNVGDSVGETTVFTMVVQKQSWPPETAMDWRSEPGNAPMYLFDVFLPEGGGHIALPPQDLRGGVSFGRILGKDGPWSTIVVLESTTPVIWTKPEDYYYDPKGPLPPFGGTFGDKALALFFSGDVSEISLDTEEAQIRAAISYNDGVEPDLNR